ncbi:MAG: amidophosphoribosyltransferase, partial [Oscillospiraceae bacterium]|nr:amidophosphoribosyltransferase [Oscillospiraceae bacterium]
VNHIKGHLSLVHNGNLTNSPELRDQLAYTGAIFQTTIDSELIAYLVARERIGSGSVEEAVGKAMKKLRGAYSLVIMSPRKLIGARDPYGFRPLVLGRRDSSFIFASETCALDTIGAEYVRDVEPGEIVTVNSDGEIISDRSNCLPKDRHGHCIFEYIYFARPDSSIDGISVYESRIKAGRYLYEDDPIEADVVAGVPESGNVAALGYSMASGIPFGQVFVKNSYIGRTFIKPGQKRREDSVMVKLNAMKSAVAGKRVVIVDD